MVNHSTTTQHDEYIVKTKKDYSIADDEEYVHCNNNDSTRQLYNYIKKLAINAYSNFKHKRHVVIQTEKFAKNRKSTKSLDLSDKAGNLN